MVVEVRHGFSQMDGGGAQVGYLPAGRLRRVRSHPVAALPGQEAAPRRRARATGAPPATGTPPVGPLPAGRAVITRFALR